MKQQVGFFSTDSMKFFRNNGFTLLAHLIDAAMGMAWVGILWLLCMYFYKMYFVYKPNQDDKKYKVIYREMNKKSR